MVDESVELARRVGALMEKHTTPTERDPGPGPDLAQLERREALVLDWHRRELGTGALVITDMTGVDYSYGEIMPDSGTYGWEPIAPEPPAVAPDAPPVDEEPAAEDTTPENDLAAALAALDARKG
jgi:hypothetical protein